MQRDHWQTIRDRLADDIAAGIFAAGAQLPTEPELCARFSAGRHSVRRAIGALAIEGKLRVEQGRGTFVDTPPLITYRIGRRTRFRQNLQEQGIKPGGEHISHEIIAAPPRVAAALGLDQGARVHRTLRRGLADGLPISLALSFHCTQRFPDLGDIRAQAESLTEAYRRYGIDDYLRKDTTLFSRRADPGEAKLLGQHRDHPVLVVTKTDVGLDGQPIGYSETVWAGDRVQFRFDALDDPDRGPAG